MFVAVGYDDGDDYAMTVAAAAAAAAAAAGVAVRSSCKVVVDEALAVVLETVGSGKCPTCHAISFV